MIRKLFILQFIVFFTLLNFAKADVVYSIRTNKIDKKVKAKNLHGVDYINSKQLANSIFKNYKFDKKANKFTSKEFNISFIPGSFFILADDWSGPKISQMNLPVLNVFGDSYFPLLGLVSALDSLGVYDVSLSKDNHHISLQSNRYFSYGSLPKLPKLRIINRNTAEVVKYQVGKTYSDITPFKDEFLSSANKLVESLKVLKPTKNIIKIKDEESKQNELNQKYLEKIKAKKSKLNKPYNMPKGLKRKELEEVKKSKSGGME